MHIKYALDGYREHFKKHPLEKPTMTEDQIKHMVDRFLGWKLPEHFSPDGGISFKKTFNDHLPKPSRHEPSGTNLFDGGQAGDMVRYMVEGLPGAPTEGRIPDREAFWLVERKVQPPQYVGTGAGWTQDPWRATRFDTERQAHDHWRTMPIFRDESAVIEHLFINKQ